MSFALCVAITLFVVGVGALTYTYSTGDDRFLSLGIACSILIGILLTVMAATYTLKHATWVITTLLGCCEIGVGLGICWVKKEYYLPEWIESFGVIVAGFGLVVILAALNYTPVSH